jgi:uncharacterized repeat protein (TIGR01451 family)
LRSVSVWSCAIRDPPTNQYQPYQSNRTSREKKQMMKSKKRFSVLLIAALTLMVAGAGFAQRHLLLASAAKPEVKLQLAAAVERDSALLPLDNKTVVNPGEILDWTIMSENSGNAAAREYQTVGHIPRGTTFIASSAKADGAKTVFSIDNGKTFSAQPMIEVKQADGSVKQVAAPVSMYTEIRYEWADPLAAGGKLSASYKVRVK